MKRHERPQGTCILVTQSYRDAGYAARHEIVSSPTHFPASDPYGAYKIAAYYASELGIGGGHYAVLVFLNGNADHMIALANVVQHVKAFCNATKDGMDTI